MAESAGTSQGTAGKAADMDFELPGYGDLEQVGSGGMAVVYAAIQSSFGRKVAIKVLRPSFTSESDFADRFMREAKIVSSLAHPHIVPVYDFGNRNGVFYMVMEYLDGGDLSKRIQRGLQENEILQIVSEIASALHFANEKGFIHRDVKPENVMFREDGSSVLTDFGIARQQDANSQMTKAGQTIGTPRYMSPQQVQGKGVDGRSDIYSLGIMFYEMLMKQTPYQDEDFMALALKHLQAPIPKFPPQFSRYQKLFERMVAKEPEKRFQNGAEVVEVIQQIRSGKLDVTAVESGAAVALKHTLQPSASKAAFAEKTSAPTGKIRLPREVMIALQDLDPLFDREWLALVTALLAKLDEDEKQHVYHHFLAPKGIVRDNRNQLVFPGRKTVQEVMAEDIRHPGLQALGQKLLKMELMLRSTVEIHVFADAIESGLSVINNFDAQENLAVQKEKIILRNAFLDDLVPLVRGASFVVPPNRRSLTLDAIKTYIVEVYLKHEVMGYRFKTQSYSTLEENKNTFIKTIVAEEARIRQCDVVRTEGFYFLIGPARDSTQNSYSIRRFLHEDSTMEGQMVYFNVVAIPFDALDKPEAQENIRWQLSRIVTLQRQLSLAITDLIQKMEESYKKELRPLLLRELSADGSDIETEIRQRLGEYERKLSLQLIGKLPKILREMAKTQDDYEYTFINIRRLVIELACDVRDFAAQSSAMWSDNAEKLDCRMMAYLKLLDKRKEYLFSKAVVQGIKPAQDAALLTQELKNTLSQFETEIEELNEQLRQSILAQEKKKNVFQRLMEKWFGSGEKVVTPEEFHRKIDQAKNRCVLALIKIIKRYPLITVYLEFEGIASVEEGMRRYALSAGSDGVARIPQMLTIHEKPENINLGAVKKMIEEDAFNASGWQGSLH
jgi:serine/threonine-protein kinase PpkA